MLDRGNYFPGQSRDEKVILFRKRHPVTFVPWAIISLFLFIIIPIIIYYIISTYFFDISNFSTFFTNKPAIYWIIVLYSMWFLSILAVFLNSWINFYLNTTVVTTKHLVDIRQNGLFNHRVAQQNLLQVQDVSFDMRGIFQTYFKYGKVMIETAGDQPNFEIPGISRPYKVANTIMELHRELVESSIKTDPLKERLERMPSEESPHDKEFPHDKKSPHDLVRQDDQNFSTEKETDLSEMEDEQDTFNESENNQTSDHGDINSQDTENHLEGDLEEGKSIKL